MRECIDRLLERLAKARTLPEAAQSVREIGFGLGFDHVAAVEDFTAEGLARSRREGLLGETFGCPALYRGDLEADPMADICPIARACRLDNRPFVWRAGAIGEARFSWDKRTRDFWRDAAAQGLVGGITAPVHMPLSRVGAVGWITTAELDFDDLLDRWGTRLRMAALLFMDHVQRERPPCRAPPNPALSARELQCLTWVALGKTDTEIAELIGRSPATARFHIESAVGKLAVNNRARAAAVASQMGLIRAVA